MLTLFGVQSDDGLYLSLNPRNEYVYSSYNDRLKNDVRVYLFDGKPGEETFHAMWVKLAGVPGRVTHTEKPTRIYGDFRLIDESMASEKIPLELTFDDVKPGDEGDWTTGNAHLQSLYQRTYTDPPPVEIDDEFELVMLATVQRVDAPERMAYTVQRTSYRHEGFEDITNASLAKQTLDKVLFPSLMMHEQPSALTSEQVYKIIREHVKNHIDPQAAEITSDYDFCFTVQKLVRLAKPKDSYRTTGTGRRERKIPVTITTRKADCFEMTHAGRNYDRYTPIPGMIAESETALKRKMDAYLDALMAYINDPWAECQHCDWTGMIHDVTVKKPTFTKE